MIRLLVLTTLYPNACQPRHGIFVEERLRNLLETGEVEAKVVAPVPWFPSRSSLFGRYATYPSVPEREMRHGVDVLHPRFPVFPKVGMGIAPVLLGRSLLPKLRRIMEDGYDFDIIDAHYFYPDGVAATWLGERVGKPVVITARGTDVNLIPQYRWPKRQILRASSRAAAMITVSQALKDALIDLGVEERKISVLANGVDLNKFYPCDGTATRESFHGGKIVWLSVGHLIDRKGHDIAIKAAAREPDVTLIIIGDGPEELALRRLAADLGASSRVRFLGHVDHSELPKYYSAADALVLASSREGMPNVVLEAIACGTPVIATAVWGTPEVIASPIAGELMGERTAQAMQAAWKRLRQRSHERGETRKYANRFGWNATSDGQIKVFESVLADSMRNH